MPASPTFSPPVEEREPTNEALQKLQISDALQRRASKRYSAYNFAKLDIDAESSVVGGPRPPIPSGRSGSFSPELQRSPNPERTSPRKRSPDRRPIESSLREEDEAQVESRPGSVVIKDMSNNEVRDTSPEKIPVFLQLGSAVRKALVSLTELSLQSLRLLFVEKFQFNPGVDTFPDILVTDRETGVRYILEEGVQDITEGTVLTLNVEGKTAFSREG